MHSMSTSYRSAFLPHYVLPQLMHRFYCMQLHVSSMQVWLLLHCVLPLMCVSVDLWMPSFACLPRASPATVYPPFYMHLVACLPVPHSDTFCLCAGVSIYWLSWLFVHFSQGISS